MGNGPVVDDVDLDRITDFEGKLVQLGPGDVDPPGVPSVAPDLFASHQV